jgi:hypothetical protein
MWTVAGAQVVVIIGFSIIYEYIYSGVIMVFLSTLPFVFGLLYNDQDIRIIAAHLRRDLLLLLTQSANISG